MAIFRTPEAPIFKRRRKFVLHDVQSKRLHHHRGFCLSVISSKVAQGIYSTFKSWILNIELQCRIIFGIFDDDFIRVKVSFIYCEGLSKGINFSDICDVFHWKSKLSRILWLKMIRSSYPFKNLSKIYTSQNNLI